MYGYIIHTYTWAYAENRGKILQQSCSRQRSSTQICTHKYTDWCIKNSIHRMCLRPQRFGLCVEGEKDSCAMQMCVHTENIHAWMHAYIYRKQGHDISVLRLDWNDFLNSEKQKEKVQSSSAYDLIIGSDLLYTVSTHRYTYTYTYTWVMLRYNPSYNVAHGWCT